MNNQVKHKGCAQCGTKDEPILVSVTDYKTMVGRAPCSNCVRAESKG